MIWFKRIVLILAVILLGTAIDFVVHHLNPYFSVPSAYFTHKIFYGTFWGLIGYKVFKKWIGQSSFRLAFVVAAVPAVLLQTMYLIQGHQLVWVVFLFLVLHFFMFLLPGYFIFKRYKSLYL